MASMNSSLNSTAAVGGEGDALLEERVLQAHDAEADRTVALFAVRAASVG